MTLQVSRRSFLGLLLASVSALVVNPLSFGRSRTLRETVLAPQIRSGERFNRFRGRASWCKWWLPEDGELLKPILTCVGDMAQEAMTRVWHFEVWNPPSDLDWKQTFEDICTPRYVQGVDGACYRERIVRCLLDATNGTGEWDVVYEEV